MNDRGAGLLSTGSPVLRHALFLVLLLVGAALRVLAALAYRPVLVFNDSAQYLEQYAAGWEPGLTKPAGYVIMVLRPVLAVADLSAVAVVQHALGLLTALAAYAVLLRCRVPRWLAALATAPILLDGYVVQVEQVVMPEALFHLLLMIGLGLLVWWRPPSPAAAIAAGVVLAGAVTVRNVGVALVAPVVVYLLVSGGGWVRRIGVTVAALAAFGAPLVAYAFWFQHFHGSFRLTEQAAPLLYGRVAVFVDCSTMDVPAYQRPLCPKLPAHERPGPGMYVHAPESPIVGYRAPAGMDRGHVIQDFAVRAILHQPLDYLRAVASDVAWGFIWTKSNKPGNPAPVERWQFQVGYPTYFDDTAGFLRPYDDEPPSARPGLARVLRGYQLTAGYTPGTVVLLCLVAGGLGALGAGRARRSDLRAACLVWTLVPAALLVLPSAVFEFTWRYQIPGIVLAPVAGALGLTAIFARPDGTERDTAQQAPTDPPAVPVRIPEAEQT